MISLTSPWRRVVRGSGLLGLSLWAAGCLSAPPPDVSYDRTDTAGEVFRVFCRRVAREAYPADLEGWTHNARCDEGDGEQEEHQGLRMLLRHRETILSTLRRTFAEEETKTNGVYEFEEGELSGFLRALVPLYDPPAETIPTATRGIATLLQQLTDKENPRAVKVLETVERLVKRIGYRQPEMQLGAVRALLTYPELDTLADTLLPVVSGQGAAKDEFIAVLNALALELADEPVPVANRDDATLRHVIELALTQDEKQKSGNIDPAPVLLRDEKGDALLAEGVSTTDSPFPVAGREDDASGRDNQGLATQGGQPAYQSVDASQTLLAALMRETSRLIGRGEKDRSPLEIAAHGIKPLLGPWGSQTFRIGENDYKFQGPDVSKSPMLQLLHVATSAARYPETVTLLRAIDQLLLQDESAATAVDYAAMHIADLSKDPRFDGAKLLENHEFWTDLIAAAERMNKRPGLFDALIRSFTKGEAAAQGKLFAAWMRHRDQITYPNYPSTNMADVNKLAEGEYQDPVDRDQPDVGMNRSIWQRTMSLINGLNGVKVCNKKGAILTAHTGIGLLTFPIGDLAGAGYPECDLVEIPDAVEIYSRAVIKKGTVGIKDSFANILAVIGSMTGLSGTVGGIQEKESEITGFNTEPTPQALARFIFAPRNDWTKALFDPQLTRDGLPIAEYEPNALFPMELATEQTPLDGKASNFITIGTALIEAFDSKELRMLDPVTNTGPLLDGYMFGHLLSEFHKHWPTKKNDPCPPTVEEGNEGCTQSLDRAAPLYSPQTGLSTYEELIAAALDDEELVPILHKATVALEKIKVPGPNGAEIDGIAALANFLQRMITPDPALKKYDGTTTSKTNACVEENGACKDNVGRFIPQLSPAYMLADALHAIDETWKTDKERQEFWQQGRSDILDIILDVTRTGDTYQLTDRTAYHIVHPVVDWAIRRIEAHRTANDLEVWTDGLAERLAKVLRHPITAATIDLLEAFWPEEKASGEFTKVVAYLTDDSNPDNRESFRGLLTAIADSMILLDRDPKLSPAIQFAALAIAPNAFQAIDGQAAPNANESAAYAALELTGGVVKQLNDPEQNKFKKDGEPTSLTKLLNNAVLATADTRSALETMIDAVADVNRPREDATTLDPLSADEDRDVFDDVRLFLRDDNGEVRSLERLYKVIQNRQVK